MEIVDTVSFAPLGDREFSAGQILRTENASARVIRIGPGQDLPAHTHGVSDLFLLAMTGSGVLTAPDGSTTPFPQGTLAHFTGDEELRVGNPLRDQDRAGEATELTLLAVLSPPFPPAR
ncbi:MAG: hypothetical protein KBB39_05200 [Phycicoccus sp.]|nr:hypothetical protein [Phycicoccus sp.]